MVRNQSECLYFVNCLPDLRLVAEETGNRLRREVAFAVPPVGLVDIKRLPVALGKTRTERRALVGPKLSQHLPTRVKILQRWLGSEPETGTAQVRASSQTVLWRHRTN
jgi:hypothetical protein